MATISLIKNAYFSWKKRGAIFISVFGTIWLFLEPISEIKLGYTEYFSLIIGSFLISSLVEMIYIVRDKKNYNLLIINIVIHEDGRRYKVETSEDMLIDNFIKKFAQETESIMNSIKWNVENAEVVLEYSRQNSKIQADKKKTFKEQGINEKDLCSLRVFAKTSSSGSFSKTVRLYKDNKPY